MFDILDNINIVLICIVITTVFNAKLYKFLLFYIVFNVQYYIFKN